MSNKHILDQAVYLEALARLLEASKGTTAAPHVAELVKKEVKDV